MNRLYGLLGEKLGHSISPEIHQTFFNEISQQATYQLFEVKKEKLNEVITGLNYLGFAGVNVTIPYKIDIIEHLDSISREAENIGAVNTIHFKANKTIGYNTDYYGFARLLDKFNIEVSNKKVVILGNGGATKAVIQYLEDKAVESITLVSRKESLDKSSKYKVINYEEFGKTPVGDIIINCTPVGMYPNMDGSPVENHVFSGFEAAVDLIYNPLETLFLKHAKAAGCKTANGLYMLVGQAIAAQEIWNEKSFNKELVDKIYIYLMEKMHE